MNHNTIRLLEQPSRAEVRAGEGKKQPYHFQPDTQRVNDILSKLEAQFVKWTPQGQDETQPLTFEQLTPEQQLIARHYQALSGLLKEGMWADRRAYDHIRWYILILRRDPQGVLDGLYEDLEDAYLQFIPIKTKDSFLAPDIDFSVKGGVPYEDYWAWVMVMAKQGGPEALRLLQAELKRVKDEIFDPGAHPLNNGHWSAAYQEMLLEGIFLARTYGPEDIELKRGILEAASNSDVYSSPHITKLANELKGLDMARTQHHSRDHRILWLYRNTRLKNEGYDYTEAVLVDKKSLINTGKSEHRDPDSRSELRSDAVSIRDVHQWDEFEDWLNGLRARIEGIRDVELPQGDLLNLGNGVVYRPSGGIAYTAWLPSLEFHDSPGAELRRIFEEEEIVSIHFTGKFSKYFGINLPLRAEMVQIPSEDDKPESPLIYRLRLTPLSDPLQESRAEVRAVDEEEIREKLKETLEQSQGSDLEEGVKQFAQTLNELSGQMELQGAPRGILPKILFDAVQADETLLWRIGEFRGALEEKAKQSGPGNPWAGPARVLQNLGIGGVVEISPEMSPVSQGGGLARVIQGRPRALVKAAIPVTVITLLYEEEQGKSGSKHKKASEILSEGIDLDDQKVIPQRLGEIKIPYGPIQHSSTREPIEAPHTEKVSVYGAELEGVRVFFLRHPKLARKLYPSSPDYSAIELIKQSILLSRGSLEVIRQFGIRPSMILANDWMAAPTFSYLRTHPEYQKMSEVQDTKLGMIIHNLGRDYQGFFMTNEEFYKDLFPLFGLGGDHYFGMSDPTDPGYLNLLRGGIFHSDFVQTVSSVYAEQIVTPEYGEKLDRDLYKKREHLYGISNGIDSQKIRGAYDAGNPGDFEKLFETKKGLKREIQQKYGLHEDEKATLISLVGRLAEQKGVKLIAEEAQRILDENPRVQLLVAGGLAERDSDASRLKEVFESLQSQEQYKGRIAGAFYFLLDPEPLRIIQASDLFLMPSRFEPGGLTQLESLALGTVVVGHNVGGIAATLVDYDQHPQTGNAFLFTGFNGWAFRNAVHRAVTQIQDEQARKEIVRRTASSRHDWSDRVPDYRAMLQREAGISDAYQKIVAAKGTGVAIPPGIKKYLRTVRSEARSRSEGVTPQMPAWELLEALGLRELEKSQALVFKPRKGPRGSTVRRIRLPKLEILPAIPQGLEILQTDLANQRDFDLLYSVQGQLIAVFPVIEKGATEGKFEYFDLSAFYFELPSLDSPQLPEQWETFASAWRQNQKIIETYKGKLPPTVSLIAVDSWREPYGFFELDSETGELNGMEFNPDEFQKLLEEFSPGDPSKPQIIFPIFPSVYTPAALENLLSDLEYHQSIFGGRNHFAIEKKDRVLVAGPGTGVDGWAASLRTQQKIYAVGINPLEIANARATAKIAGFPIEAKVHDNIISEKGKPAFRIQFDKVLRNMPSLAGAPDLHFAGKKRLHEHWDSDYGGKVLQRFASGLASVLKPEGRAMIWNTYSVSDSLSEPDPIERIFNSKGLEVEKEVIHSGIALYLIGLRAEVRAIEGIRPQSFDKIVKKFEHLFQERRFREEGIRFHIPEESYAPRFSITVPNEGDIYPAEEFNSIDYTFRHQADKDLWSITSDPFLRLSDREETSIDQGITYFFTSTRSGFGKGMAGWFFPKGPFLEIQNPLIDTTFDLHKKRPQLVVRDEVLDWLRERYRRARKPERKAFYEAILKDNLLLKESEALRMKKEDPENLPGLEIDQTLLVQFQKEDDGFFIDIRREGEFRHNQLDKLEEWLNRLKHYKINVVTIRRPKAIAVQSSKTGEWKKLNLNQASSEEIASLLEEGLVPRAEVRSDSQREEFFELLQALSRDSGWLIQTEHHDDRRAFGFKGQEPDRETVHRWTEEEWRERRQWLDDILRDRIQNHYKLDNLLLRLQTHFEVPPGSPYRLSEEDRITFLKISKAVAPIVAAEKPDSLFTLTFSVSRFVGRDESEVVVLSALNALTALLAEKYKTRNFGGLVLAPHLEILKSPESYPPRVVQAASEGMILILKYVSKDSELLEYYLRELGAGEDEDLSQAEAILFGIRQRALERLESPTAIRAEIRAVGLGGDVIEGVVVGIAFFTAAFFAWGILKVIFSALKDYRAFLLLERIKAKVHASPQRISQKELKFLFRLIENPKGPHSYDASLALEDLLREFRTKRATDRHLWLLSGGLPLAHEETYKKINRFLERVIVNEGSVYGETIRLLATRLYAARMARFEGLNEGETLEIPDEPITQISNKIQHSVETPQKQTEVEEFETLQRPHLLELLIVMARLGMNRKLRWDTLVPVGMIMLRGDKDPANRRYAAEALGEILLQASGKPIEMWEEGVSALRDAASAEHEKEETVRQAARSALWSLGESLSSEPPSGTRGHPRAEARAVENLFPGEKRDGPPRVGEEDVKTRKEIFPPEKVEAYSEVRRKADRGFEKSLTNFDREAVKVDRDRVAVPHSREDLDSLPEIQSRTAGIDGRKDGDRSSGIDVGLSLKPDVSAVNIKLNNRAGVAPVDFVREDDWTSHLEEGFLRQKKSTDRKSLGLGTGIPRIGSWGPYVLRILFSIFRTLSLGPTGNTFPRAIRIYGNRPPYLSTIISKLPLTQASLSNPFLFFAIQITYTTVGQSRQTASRAEVRAGDAIFEEVTAQGTAPQRRKALISALQDQAFSGGESAQEAVTILEGILLKGGDEKLESEAYWAASDALREIAERDISLIKPGTVDALEGILQRKGDEKLESDAYWAASDVLRVILLKRPSLAKRSTVRALGDHLEHPESDEVRKSASRALAAVGLAYEKPLISKAAREALKKSGTEDARELLSLQEDPTEERMRSFNERGADDPLLRNRELLARLLLRVQQEGGLGEESKAFVKALLAGGGPSYGKARPQTLKAFEASWLSQFLKDFPSPVSLTGEGGVRLGAEFLLSLSALEFLDQIPGLRKEDNRSYSQTLAGLLFTQTGTNISAKEARRIGKVLGKLGDDDPDLFSSSPGLELLGILLKDEAYRALSGGGKLLVTASLLGGDASLLPSEVKEKLIPSVALLESLSPLSFEITLEEAEEEGSVSLINTRLEPLRALASLGGEEESVPLKAPYPVLVLLMGALKELNLFSFSPEDILPAYHLEGGLGKEALLWYPLLYLTGLPQGTPGYAFDLTPVPSGGGKEPVPLISREGKETVFTLRNLALLPQQGELHFFYPGDLRRLLLLVSGSRAAEGPLQEAYRGLVKELRRFYRERGIEGLGDKDPLKEEDLHQAIRDLAEALGLVKRSGEEEKILVPYDPPGDLDLLETMLEEGLQALEKILYPEDGLPRDILEKLSVFPKPEGAEPLRLHDAEGFHRAHGNRSEVRRAEGGAEERKLAGWVEREIRAEVIKVAKIMAGQSLRRRFQKYGREFQETALEGKLGIPVARTEEEMDLEAEDLEKLYAMASALKIEKMRDHWGISEAAEGNVIIVRRGLAIKENLLPFLRLLTGNKPLVVLTEERDEEALIERFNKEVLSKLGKKEILSLSREQAESFRDKEAWRSWLEAQGIRLPNQAHFKVWESLSEALDPVSELLKKVLGEVETVVPGRYHFESSLMNFLVKEFAQFRAEMRALEAAA